jgi:probable F420-dependent oxidoreductase
MVAMHAGIKVPNWGPLAGPDALVSTAVAADDRGFDSVWVSDHVAVPRAPLRSYPYDASSAPPFEPSTPFLEALIALAHVAAVTSRVQLGTGVLVLPLRQPLLVAKQVGSLDVLSRGRAVLGIGAGWLADEFVLLGQEFADRGRRTDDDIRTLRACWARREVTVPGLDAPAAVAVEPAPVRQDVPVLIGGHSRAALRRAAGLGDGWYASNISPHEFGKLVESLRTLPGGGAVTVGARPGVIAAADAASVVSAFGQAGADFVVLDAPYATASATEALDWVHRTADALHPGSGQPLVTRAASSEG